MNSVIKQKIHSPEEAQLFVEVGDILTPEQAVAQTPQSVKRFFLSHLFNQKQEDKVVIAVSVGDEVTPGDALIFYPRALLRLVFAIKTFFSDEERSKSYYITQFLLDSKSHKKWWLSLFVPFLPSPSSGVVELISPEGNMVVLKCVKDDFSLLAETYGNIESIANNRIEISSLGTLLTAGFGYGSRVAGFLKKELKDDASLLFENKVLDREKVIQLAKSSCRGVVANGITVDAVVLLNSPEFSCDCSIVAFSIVQDISSFQIVIRDVEFDSSIRVTLLPLLHPYHGRHSSAIIIHEEER